MLRCIAFLALLGPTASCSTSEERTTLTVFAAASLTDVMADLARAFEADHPDVSVDLSFGPSSALRESILAGAPADVFASADQRSMEVLVAADAVMTSEAFTSNVLAIAVPPGNPAKIVGLEDFSRDSLFLGLCAPQVPCGALAREALSTSSVVPAPDTEATDVRALLTQVASGDLDAGIVYRTDVLAAGGEVDGIAVPSGSNARAVYPIAVLERSRQEALARSFIGFVRSPDGQDILRAFGFGAP